MAEELGQVQPVGRHAHTGNDSPKIVQGDINGPVKDVTQDQVDALAGSSGDPSSTNTYITEDDVKDDGTASKVLRLDANSQATIEETPTADTHAASKGYVDTQDENIWYAVASATIVARDQTEKTLGTYGGANNYACRVLLPGTVTVKMRIKSTSGSGESYFLVIYGPNDEDDGDFFTGSGNAHSMLVGDTSYINNSENMNVRAGDIIVLYGNGSVMCEDFQVNFTATQTKTYASIL